MLKYYTVIYENYACLIVQAYSKKHAKMVAGENYQESPVKKVIKGRPKPR